MSLIAAVLIIISAFMHAGWNFVSKRRNPSLAFFFVTAVCGALIISPVFILHRDLLPLIPTAVWRLVLATGLAQMIYFIGLAGAYKRGDISLAYPLARALPVLLVAIISLLWHNSGEIGPLGWIGMGLITAGCIILPLPHFRQFKLTAYLNGIIFMALIAAVGTAGYTLIDDQALRQLRTVLPLSNGQVTLLFIGLQISSTALMLGLGTLLQQAERKQLRQILQTRPLLFAGFTTGLMIMSTYGLVLAAMAYVSNVSYVAAFRQLSIPLGALMGLIWQQEPAYLPKLTGIGIVSLGLILVGIG